MKTKLMSIKNDLEKSRVFFASCMFGTYILMIKLFPTMEYTITNIAIFLLFYGFYLSNQKDKEMENAPGIYALENIHLLINMEMPDSQKVEILKKSFEEAINQTQK